jgi:glycosyltransferase involved in cell wall biosynthesis
MPRPQCAEIQIGSDSVCPMYKSQALFLLPHDTLGGAERVTTTLAEAAALSGEFELVTIVVLSRGDHGKLNHLKGYSNLTIIYLPFSGPSRALFALARFLRTKSYDFVFSSLADINALLSLMRRSGILKTKYLVARESTMMFEREFGWKSHLVRVIYRLYGAQDLIISQTQEMAFSLNANTGGKLERLVRVLPNPIPYRLVESFGEVEEVGNEGVGPLRIVWCGRLSRVKSPHRAIEALAYLRDNGDPDASLLFIGDGPLRHTLEALAKERQLEDRVRFAGHLEDPTSAMTQYDVGLVTSDIEGFPNVILEMLASGVRRVASTNCAGGLEDVPGLTLSANSSPAVLARAIQEARMNAGDPSLINKFIQDRHPELLLRRILGMNDHASR